MVGRFGRLRASFLDSPVVDINGYPYFVNPVSDGIPRVDRELLDEIVDGFMESSDLDFDVLLAPEAMGIHLATCVSVRTGIPFSVIRKRPYGLPGEIRLDQTTGTPAAPCS